MKKYCRETYIDKLKEINWESVFLCSNVNDAWACFKQMFLQIIDA